MGIRANPRIAVSVVYVAAMFMAAMDATIVNVALKTISGEFGIPISASGLISICYLVSLSMVLPVAGWLGDRFGTKRIFLLALTLFTVASALCGIAENLGQLTLYRILQGVGGGLLTPVGMAMLFRTFPPEERARVSRTLVLPIAVAPALGPIVSGLLVDQLSWRWAFYINIPIGIAAILIGLLYLQEHRQPGTGRLDVPGFLLATPGMALLVYALTLGPEKGWLTPGILISGLAGLALLAALVKVELRTEQPMLDLRLLSGRLYRIMSLISLCAAAGLLGMLYIFPLMYQDALHASPLEAGLTTFPEALGLMVSTQLVPKLYRRLGPRKLMSIGLIGASVVFVLLSLTTEDTSPWLIRVELFAAGLCLGHVVGSVQASVFNQIPGPSMGRATTLFTALTRLGSALGLALLAGLLAVAGTVTADTASASQASPDAYRAALLGAVGFLLIALALALRIRQEDTVSIKPGPPPASNPQGAPGVPAAVKAAAE